MSCEYCIDENGENCYPMYGLAPHKHIGGEQGLFSTVMLPKEQWPSNFEEDPQCPGLGIWSCKHCGKGK